MERALFSACSPRRIINVVLVAMPHADDADDDDDEDVTAVY